MKKQNKICHKLGRCTRKLTTIGIISAIFVIMTAYTAFAADNPLAAAGLSGGVLYKVYNFFRVLSVPIAAVGAVMCAFSFFLPNEKGFELAKKRLLNIGIALLVLMAIPMIYKYSSNMVRGWGWKSEGGNTQIIENAVPDNVDLTNIGPTPAAP